MRRGIIVLIGLMMAALPAHAGTRIKDIISVDYAEGGDFGPDWSTVKLRAASGYGPRHIEAELRSHGIDPREHAEALREPDWRALAKRAFLKRFGTAPLEREQRLKAAAFLARRGFPANIVYAVTGTRTEDAD